MNCVTIAGLISCGNCKKIILFEMRHKKLATHIAFIRGQTWLDREERNGIRLSHSEGRLVPNSLSFGLRKVPRTRFVLYF